MYNIIIVFSYFRKEGLGRDQSQYITYTLELHSCQISNTGPFGNTRWQKQSGHQRSKYDHLHAVNQYEALGTDLRCWRTLWDINRFEVFVSLRSDEALSRSYPSFLRGFPRDSVIGNKWYAVGDKRREREASNSTSELTWEVSSWARFDWNKN